ARARPPASADARPACRARHWGRHHAPSPRAPAAGRKRASGRKQTRRARRNPPPRSEEHTSELQSRENLVCRLLLEKKKNILADFPLLTGYQFREYTTIAQHIPEEIHD